MRKLLILSFLCFLVAGLINCRHGYNNETKISSYGSDESHNQGKNCMDCHRLGGDGEGWFMAAGTIYDPVGNTVPNATIRLYTGLNGSGRLIATLQGDAKGNFYTTEKIDFGTGLFPLVTDRSGNTVFMSSAIGSGACNSCHGVSTAAIHIP